MAPYLSMRDCGHALVAHSLRTRDSLLMLQLSSAPVRPSLLLPSLAAIVAIGIFVVDTVTPLDIAVAVLYVAVVLLAMDFAGRNGILIVAGGCAALTVLSYAITHGHDPASGPFLRCLISLVAIAITGALAARHQGTIEALRAHASLLDLTHDTIFVRNHDDVITYWNRAATELYGWRPEQAIGRKAAELLHTGFPAPFDDIMSELNRSRTLGRRIGAYRPRRQASRRGQPLGPAARRPRPSRRHPRDQQRHHRAPPGRGRPGARPGRARPCRARRHAGRAHRLDRPRGQPAAGRRRHQWRGLPALARTRRSRHRPGAQLGRAHDQERPARQRGGAPAARPVAQERSVLCAALPGRRRERRGAADRPRAAEPSRHAQRERDRRSCRSCRAIACSSSRSS